MASSVFYKFKSQREESKVSFDGTGISVFDLKKEIILANNLGKSSDFDLLVFDGSSGEGLSQNPPTITVLFAAHHILAYSHPCRA
jgi:protein MPE1